MIKFTASEDRIVRSAEALSEKLSDKFSDKEQRVLELLMEDPGFTSVQIADVQIADQLNVSRVSVTKYLKALKEKGVISRIGSDRKGYWKINQ